MKGPFLQANEEKWADSAVIRTILSVHKHFRQIRVSGRGAKNPDGTPMHTSNSFLPLAQVPGQTGRNY